SVDIDTTAQITGSEVIQPLAVHVQSDQPVAVYGLSNRKASTDTYVALPSTVLGNSYRAMGYYPLGNDDSFTSQIDTVGNYDKTDVVITPTANTKGGRSAGETFTVTLNQGEVYQVQSTTRKGREKSDLTGTLVTSTKPISFFT